MKILIQPLGSGRNCDVVCNIRHVTVSIFSLVGARAWNICLRDQVEEIHGFGTFDLHELALGSVGRRTKGHLVPCAVHCVTYGTANSKRRNKEGGEQVPPTTYT